MTNDMINSEDAAVERLNEVCQQGDSCSFDEVKDLVQRFPNAIRVPDEDGMLPLHHACSNGCLDEVILFLLDCWPESVRRPTNTVWSFLPLHCACEGKCSLKVIQMLVQAWPDCVREHRVRGEEQSCGYEYLPLHYACKYDCTDEVIQFLLQCWPEAVRCWSDIDTWNSMLPLHYACERGGEYSLTTIQLLVQAWPDSVREQNNRGNLPLHYACRKGCTDEVIEFLVRSWPESCQVPSKVDDQLPLHLVCDRHDNEAASSAVIPILLDCFPRAVQYKDKNRQLPLHIACRRRHALELEVMEHLVRAWPESIFVACPYTVKGRTYW